MFLLANYLNASRMMYGVEVTQLRCNGIFSVCDRDSERDWKRGLHSCLSCMHDQRELAAWSGIPTVDISTFLTPEVIEDTRRWLMTIPAALLPTIRLGTRELMGICRESFRLRFGVNDPDFKNVAHEQFLRRLMVGVARMIQASAGYIRAAGPTLHFVAGGRDAITASYISEVKRSGEQVVLFRWEISERTIQILHPSGTGAMGCELLLDGIPQLRGDSSTWTPSLVQILVEILSFLDIRAESPLHAAG